MFRPVTFKTENDYELILMRNRREELIDIPIDYITSVDYNMGEYLQEPTKISLTIPSHLERDGKLIEFPAYNLIKGKMQLKLKVNDKKYVFTIEEESISETKKIHTKSFVAYEKHYKFNNTDFCIATDIATRQLYKTPNETVEVSDGMLNWFEQQCTGWRVRNITTKAKSELTMCSETERIDLPNIDKTITGEIFNQNVSISALSGKPLNMKMVMDCTVYDSNGGKYISQTSTFEFTNLPYAIKNIKAEYSSTSKHFYGITFTITYVNDHVSTHEYAFINCKNLRLVATTAIEYELGNLVERTVTKYRTFETTSTTWMDMLRQIAEAFDVIILFDSYNECIDVCHREEFGEVTNISLTYDNALKEITKQRKLNELVTRLTVESANTTIAGVNVLGTEYVECYDYFINNGIMSEELQHALEQYQNILEREDLKFNQLLLSKHDADQALSLANSQLVSLQSKYTTEKAILTAYIKSGEESKQTAQQKVVTDLEKQIEAKLSEVQNCKDNAASLEQQLVQIGENIKKENTGLFTDDLLLELSDYLIEKAITDDTHLTSYAVYDYAVEQIKNYQKPVIEFSINSSTEFIERTGQKVTDCIFIGAKMEVEDKAGDITNEDGTVMLYGFSIVPKTNTVSNFKFTNSAKVPDSPLKQVSKTSQAVKATKAMTDFYKSTLQKVKDQNPDVAKILEEGLDLAAQKVRSRTEQNIIEIDEAGIFLIDANNENEQLALINDLIAMTTDRWKTSRVAISPEGIMAEQLIGKVIIGEDLYIGNDTNSFKISKDPSGAYGMFMYTKKNDVDNLRIFLGIDSDGKPKLELFDEGVYDFNDEESRQRFLRVFLGVDKNDISVLKLYSKQGNKLVLSPDGMYNCYQISDRDSFDYNHSFKSYFYIPETLTETFDAKLIVRLEKFRAYSKTANSTKINLKSTESETINLTSTESETINLTSTETQSFEAESTQGSGSINLNVTLTGLSGGAENAYVGGSGSVDSTTGEAFSSGGRTTGIPNGSANNDPGNIDLNTHTHWVKLTHSHGISVDCGQHKHTISVSGGASGSADDHWHKFQVPTHSHSIDMPGHSHDIAMPGHSHDIIMPEHNHELIYGIYETTRIPTCRVSINGKDLMVSMTEEKVYQFDITTDFKGFKSGINEIEFRTTDINGLGRASFTLFWGGYYNYE